MRKSDWKTRKVKERGLVSLKSKERMFATTSLKATGCCNEDKENLFPVPMMDGTNRKGPKCSCKRLKLDARKTKHNKQTANLLILRIAKLSTLLKVLDFYSWFQPSHSACSFCLVLRWFFLLLLRFERPCPTVTTSQPLSFLFFTSF